jgi:hypothetical protein
VTLHQSFTCTEVLTVYSEIALPFGVHLPDELPPPRVAFGIHNWSCLYFTANCKAILSKVNKIDITFR